MSPRCHASRLTATLLLALTTLPICAPAFAQYERPPKAVLDILNAPPFPNAWLSPARDYLLLAERPSYPPLEELAAPKLRLAGLRVDPATNGLYRAPYWLSLKLKRVADGLERPVRLPPSAKVGSFTWTADGRRVAFTNVASDRMELWILDVPTAIAKRVEGVRLNTLLGAGHIWLPDQRTLIVKVVPADRGLPPPEPSMPSGPIVQESSGKHGIGSTYERRDVLENSHDEALFDFYTRSSLLLVDTATGEARPFARPDLYASVWPSPSGDHFIVETIHRPYSYLHPYWRFPREVEIWDRSGRKIRTLAGLPLADDVPIHGVPKGPRNYHWRPTAPASITFVEALDEGDPSKKAPHRDRILTWKAPFQNEPTELLRLKERFAGIAWSDSSGVALITEFDRERRWRRVFEVDFDGPRNAEPRVIWDLSVNEQYKDPGAPLQRPLPNGFSVLDRDGEWLYLVGAGASPEGDRPFLDRFSLRTLSAERLFRSDRASYETFAGWAAPTGRRVFLTRRESPKEPPNYHVRTLGGTRRASSGEASIASSRRPLTRFPDPTPQLRKIAKRLVTYQRADGTPLSMTVFLPPGYKKGTRLPTVLWAYPLEYSDPETAGQVSGSDQRFTTITGASPLFFILAGYAVLYDVAMPVIGHPDSVYNTYLEQVVANAQAAVNKAVEMGVADRDRVGVAGHSHGAFMTTHLLAHSDLFRAGIARSGAYNQTMRPFGFQTERRTLYEAPESYVRLSPIMHANKINEPLLLIHGEDDPNPGTIPLQSDLLYRAVAGTGGTARLVKLPLEGHGYEARESIEHTLHEMLSWFDRYVNQATRSAPSTIGRSGS